MTRIKVGRVAWWLALALVVIAGVSGLLPWSSEQLVVLAGVVIRPSGLGGALLGMAALLGVAHWTLGPGATPSQRRSVRVLRRLGWVALVVAASVSVGRASLHDVVSTYYVLEPASASGCRVVVDERSFLLLGSLPVTLL